MDVGRTATKPEIEGVSASGPDRIESSRRAELRVTERRAISRFIAPLVVFAAVSIIYSAIYFREESIPTAVGANLVPAERVLKGEIPYRDFYKIQTPGILLLNAALFKFFSVSLFVAMTGVLVFKVLAVVIVFVTGRRLGSWKTALVPAALTLLWIAPGGPFRAAPIQYETLFILAAIYFMLRWLDSDNALHAFGAGLAVGIVAVFKQNVGVYAAIALGLSIILNNQAFPRSLREAKQLYWQSWKAHSKAHIAAAVGTGLPLVALVIYLFSNRALSAAIEVFISGPREHIESRFTGYPLPKYAAIIFIASAIGLMLASRLARRLPQHEALIVALALLAAAACAAIVPQPAIDNSIYWFAPALFACAAWKYFRRDENEFAARRRERGALVVLLLFSVAAFGEVFPRSVRGLVIGSMPASFLLFAFLFTRGQFLKTAGDASASKPLALASIPRKLVFMVASLVLLIFALRIDLPEFFSFDKERGLRFKADTELAFDRGRGVYLPAQRAEEVNATVELIRSRVAEGGYFFAHSLDATSYYFLADRNSPTGATLWNDTGTNDRERARTIVSLREKNVRLVLTSEQAMKAETYQPLLDYLNNDFHPIAASDGAPLTIGKTIFLERNY